jgi:hypothetical protein
MTANPSKLAYTITEFAEAVGIGRTKAFEEIKKKRLRPTYIGGNLVITVADATAWLARARRSNIMDHQPKPKAAESAEKAPTP